MTDLNMWLYCSYLFLLFLGYWVPGSLLWMRFLAIAGALWVLACAAGYLVPLWAVLPAAVLIGSLERLTANRLRPWQQQSLNVASHWLLLGLFAIISIDQPPAWLLLLVALAHGLIATLLATKAPRWRPQRRRSVLALVTVVSTLTVSLLVANWDRTTNALSRVQLASIPFASLRAVSTPTLERLPLESGIAWHSVVRSDAKGRCALVLHGADPNGARQAASQSLIIALHELDTYVVATDHPGYGQSPVPAGSTVQAWDPGSLTQAAYDHLQLADCQGISVFGHSMGASEALRLAVSDSAEQVDSIKLLGAGVFEGTKESDSYWYRRFHKDRGLTEDAVPYDLWKQITQAYYHNGHLAEALGKQQRRSIEFYVYDYENADLAITRETLWEILDKPTRIRLPMSHYFNAVSFGPVLLLDSRAISQAKRSLSSVNTVTTLIANVQQTSVHQTDGITRRQQ